MASKFTWFPKFTRVLAAVPPEHVGEVALAIARYGTDGEEPEFSDPLLAAVFAGLREDIDNSVNAREHNGGGRPRKRKASDEPATSCAQAVETDGGTVEGCGGNVETLCEGNVDGQSFRRENPRFDIYENPVTGVTPGFETPKPPLYKPYQAIPIQANPIGGSEVNPAPAPAPETPSAGDVAAYFACNCLKGDPQLFFAHYAAQGWLTGTGLRIADWRAAALKWSRRQVGYDAERRAEGRPTAAEAEAAATWETARTETEDERNARVLAEFAERYGEEVTA